MPYLREQMVNFGVHAIILCTKKGLILDSQTFESWKKSPQMGFEPVYFKNGRFYIKGPTWTKQTVEY